MHADSGGFLALKIESSKTDQMGYKVEIDTQFSPNMFFTIEPKYKSRKTGDKIQYLDLVHFRTTVNKQNLVISPSNCIRQEELFFKENNPYIVEKIIDDLNCT